MTVFLALLLFAVQLALNLYATSAVTAVAFDAARTVAAGDDVAAAERHARSVYGGELSFEWSLRRADVVELSVVAPQRRLLPGVSVPFDTVRRTVRVRWERLR